MLQNPTTRLSKVKAKSKGELHCTPTLTTFNPITIMKTRNTLQTQTYSPNREFGTADYRPDWVMSTPSTTVPVSTSWFSENRYILITLLIIAGIVMFFEKQCSGHDTNVVSNDIYTEPFYPSENISPVIKDIPMEETQYVDCSANAPSCDITTEKSYPSVVFPKVVIPEVRTASDILKSNKRIIDKMEAIHSKVKELKKEIKYDLSNFDFSVPEPVKKMSADELLKSAETATGVDESVLDEIITASDMYEDFSKKSPDIQTLEP